MCVSMNTLHEAKKEKDINYLSILTVYALRYSMKGLEDYFRQKKAPPSATLAFCQLNNLNY
jgi:hypothetical protein